MATSSTHGPAASALCASRLPFSTLAADWCTQRSLLLHREWLYHSHRLLEYNTHAHAAIITITVTLKEKPFS